VVALEKRFFMPVEMVRAGKAEKRLPQGENTVIHGWERDIPKAKAGWGRSE